MRFFEKFRAAAGKYAEGVHDLGGPAAEAAMVEAEGRIGRALPVVYRDFLSQWNGAWLFGDDYRIYGVRGARPGEVRAAAGELIVGETPSGALVLDGEGRVVAIDAETEARAIEGSDFSRWLDATMAREGLVFDREGEFREEALDGVELSSRVRLKRAEAAAKADPGSPAWQEELGRLLEEEGHLGRAERAWERAVELDPAAAEAWFAIGKLRRAAGDAEGAGEAFARGAEVEREPEEAAFAWAHAARAAKEAGRAEEADRCAARARERRPELVAEQRAGAEAMAGEGRVEEAIERMELAAAVAAGDKEVEQALARMRARRGLRTV